MSLLRSTTTLLAVTAMLAACGDDPITPGPELTLTVTPTALTIERGESGSAAITVVRESTDDVVTVTVSGGGTGITAAIGGVAHDGDETTATLSVDIAEVVELGNYTVTVRAANGDAPDEIQAVTVTVTAPVGGGNN